jgi:pyruvate,water dikinase
MRGLAEIDFGRPRWREQPVQVMQMVQNYLRIHDPEMAPDAVFGRGKGAARAAVDRMAAAAQQDGPLGFLKARLIRGMAYRVRALSGLRESPKFTIIRMAGLFRQAALDVGAALADADLLAQAEDVVFLHLKELRHLAVADLGDEDGAAWQDLVAQRRHAYDREMGRRQIPRLLLSDGTAFYEGFSPATQDEEQAGVLRGSPVSAGVVEGPVRVVLDPYTAHMQPGEILVCPGTDPAWTPLFLSAGGLVMEVGGLMTHGSVVAREYGIPGVVGVRDCTTRLTTGQRIRVDGSTGEITLL